MSTGYVKELVAICTDLGIYVPDNIRNDQTQTKYLLTLIQTAIDTDQAKNSTGDAAVVDVRQGKTFSNAATVGLTGTLVVVDTTDADAGAADIVKDKTAYVNGAKVTGTLEPLDTSDADATEADIASGKTAYVNGVKITGTHV